MKPKIDIQRICVSGIDVAYSILGEGEKVAVILQGWGTNFEIYEQLAFAISDEYKVLLFDFPGFGKTHEPKQSWNVSEYTRFFLELCDALNIKNPTLIAHSYGGRVAIELTAKHRDFCVDKIVLIDSAGIMPQRTIKQKVKVRAYKIKKALLTNKIVKWLFTDVVEDWISRQGSEDYKNASPIMKEALVKAVNYDQRDLLCRIDNDVLLIWGDKDDATPLEDGKVMEEEIPNAGLFVLEGCGHFSFLENESVVCNSLRAFLCQGKELKESN